MAHGRQLFAVVPSRNDINSCIGDDHLSFHHPIRWHSLCNYGIHRRSIHLNPIQPSKSPIQTIHTQTNTRQSKHFSSAHQIIGIIVLLGVLTQASFGFFHHRLYKKNSTGKPSLIKIHKLFLGPIVFSLGLVNASLGLRLSNAYILNWVYLAFGLVVLIILFITSWKQAWFRRRFGANRHRNNSVFGGPPPPGYDRGFGGSTPAASTAGAGMGATAGYAASRPYEEGSTFGGDRSDIPLHQMDAPPAYDMPAQKPREFA
jgi:hypothetical protein